VNLTSSDPTELTVPATVIIAAGQTSVDFPITVVDDTRIDGTRNTTIIAHVANWTDGSATIAVQDNENLNLTLTLPVAVNEGGTNSGTVAISGTRTSALTVTLASNNTARLSVPATVSIPAGSTSATFTLTAPNNSLVDGTQVVTLTASATGFTGTTNLSGLSAALGSPVAVNPVKTEAFSSGIWTGNVTVSQTGTGITLRADDGGGHSGVSNAFDVVEVFAAGFEG